MATKLKDTNATASGQLLSIPTNPVPFLFIIWWILQQEKANM
jgi:hypothetical protein